MRASQPSYKKKNLGSSDFHVFGQRDPSLSVLSEWMCTSGQYEKGFFDTLSQNKVSMFERYKKQLYLQALNEKW